MGLYMLFMLRQSGGIWRNWSEPIFVCILGGVLVTL